MLKLPNVERHSKICSKRYMAQSELCVQPIQFEKAKHANNSLSFAKVLFEHNGFSAHNLNLPEVFLIL